MQGTTNTSFPPEVSERLAHYVYLYLHPITGKVFYVGKGVGGRAFAHLQREEDSDFVRSMAKIRSEGLSPRIDILRYGLTERQAEIVEAAVIDLFEVGLLNNEVRGKGTAEGRITADRIISELTATPIEVDVPTLLINIRRTFRHDMTENELYEKTRQSWVMGRSGRRQRKAEIVLSTFASIVREVYRPRRWYEVGQAKPGKKPRWAFDGEVAEPAVRDKYRGRSVSALINPNAQNPIKYVGC